MRAQILRHGLRNDRTLIESSGGAAAAAKQRGGGGKRRERRTRTANSTKRGRNPRPSAEPRAARPGHRPQSRGPAERRGPEEAQRTEGGRRKAAGGPPEADGYAGGRADRPAPAAASRPPKGPTGPQWRKRTAATRPTARRRYSASPMATRPPGRGAKGFAARPRMLGAGADALRAQRRFAPMRQRSRTGTKVPDEHPPSVAVCSR